MAKQTRVIDVRVSSNVGTEMSKGTVAAGGLSGALKGVAASASLATGGIRAMTMALLSSGIGAIVVAIGAVVGGMGALIMKSKSFDKELSNLAAVTGKTKDELVDLKENAKKLGATTAFTATQVLELSVAYAKLGFTTNEILKASDATLSLAAATETDLGEAAEIVGATLRGFGLDTSETTRVVNVMAKSFTTSALDVTRFKESMKLVAPIAATTKVSIEEATAALAILADRGIHGSMAGTQLRRTLSELTVKTGKPLQEALAITADKLEKASSTAEKLAIATELVGDRAKGALISLAENREELKAGTQALIDHGNAVDAMAKEKLNNLDGSITKLSSAWDGLMLSIEDGSGLLGGAAKLAVDGLTGAITYLTNQGAALGFGWDALMVFFQSVPVRLASVALSFEAMGLRARIAMEDIPFWGDDVDKAKLETQLELVRMAQAVALKDLKGFQEKQQALQDQAQLASMGIFKTKALTGDDDKPAVVDEFIEGDPEAEADKAWEAKQAFMEKLADQEQKERAKTEEEKVEYRRAKHLAELEEIVATTDEKNALKARINAIYDDQADQLELDRKAKLKAMLDKFDADHQMDETEKKLMALDLAEQETLAELDKLKATETEKNRIIAAFAAERVAINKDANDKKKADDKEDFSQKVGMAGQAVGMLSNMMEAFSSQGEGAAKKNFKIQKALSMATATISGIEAGVNAFAFGTKMGGPYVGAAMAAVSAVTTLAQIKAISQQKFRGGETASRDSLGGNMGGNQQAQAPSFNVLGATSAGDEMVAGAIGRANSQPVKAYVVESEMTSMQSLGRNAEGLASMG